jgi:predicted aspartyl protease
MGMTYIDGTVHGPLGSEDLTFLVDSGAMYTLLPVEVWRRIGLEPERTQGFTLADGTHIERSMSECRLTLPQGAMHTPVILGEPGDEALLGVVTLELLGLMLNPLTRQLERMRLRL